MKLKKMMNANALVVVAIKCISTFMGDIMSLTIDNQVKKIIENNLPQNLEIGLINYCKNYMEFYFIDSERKKPLITDLSMLGQKVREQYNIRYDITDYKNEYYLNFYVE